jgi:NADPH-dependent glutamate synthase beta subunit-like oxidoreductase/NAD(P)H-flavin reductase
MSELKLGLPALTFPDLFRVEGLRVLDEAFLARLQAQDGGLAERLSASRAGKHFSPMETSELLLGCAPVLEDLIAELFAIGPELERSRQQTLSHDPVFAFKKLFVQRRARRRLLAKEEIEDFATLDAWLSARLAQPESDRELAVARYGGALLAEPQAHEDEIEKLTRWCVRALTVPAGRQAVVGWASFDLPEPLDYQHLVAVQPIAGDAAGRVEAPPATLHRRDGFGLTDQRMTPRAVQNEVNYCIYCHDHDGDFCSKGFPVKKGEPAQGIKVNPLGVIQTGCPVEEKISEMHTLKRDGHTIGALAMAMVDNPMVPATGHRICNDCMKGCIYQKQEPVDIPQIETSVLVDVLELPWGVEIYDLLTRWNPLRPRQWLPRPYNGGKVLVVGMGPAGFTLAHHLLMEGFAVVGIDGLKIEPLPAELIANPVRAYADLKEDLGTRVMSGFGGVAEYGITVRWDKNFLKLIYLSLARRPHFQVFGGVRFGGTVKVEDAWELGFDHVSIAAGAGLPKTLPIENSLARGMRQAVDFLMALQLTGAAKASSLTNLQVRLPAVVVGGGLTAVDTATEVQAYYITQVEKILTRYERLAETFGEARVRDQFDEESIAILNEFLDHARVVREERRRAAAAGEQPDFTKLVRQWGGVTVVYRRAMRESPAYTRNHGEVQKAMEEGVYYAEALDPTAARLDEYGHVESLVCRRQVRGEDGKWRAGDEEVVMPARAIFVATGSTPNIIYHWEHRQTFAIEGNHFQTHRARGETLEPVPVAAHCKVDVEDAGVFTSYRRDDHRVTFLGDTHPVFNGSVVKAIASGKRIYPQVVASVGAKALAHGDAAEYAAFRSQMNGLLQPRVESVTRHSPTVIEVRVRAPLAAKNFNPGQFFRLQNFERQSPVVNGTRLQTEALAISGAGIDGDLVSLMVLEVGASSRVCATLRPGEPVALMGPTGVRTDIPSGKTIMVLGGRRGAAYMRAVGPALRAAGNRVLYIAGFQTADEVYCQGDLEAAADAVVWVTAAGTPVTPRRPQDRACTGDFVDVVRRYATGELHDDARPPIRLQEVDRVLVVGTNRLVRLIRDARCGPLREYFAKSAQFTASVSSPMQCMLKGVCSQCLQWQVDPATGKRTKVVFACSWQDQPMDIVDWDNLDARLAQNRVQEGLTNLWLDYLFAHDTIPRV